MPFGTMYKLDLWSSCRQTDVGYNDTDIYNFPLFINEPKFNRELKILKFQFSFTGRLDNTVGHTEDEDKCYPFNRNNK